MTKKEKQQKANRLAEIANNISSHFNNTIDTSDFPFRINSRIREIQEAKQLLIELENALIKQQFPSYKN